MRIGIFDSGLGGLLIAKAIRKALPQYDYVYLGDTKRVPYGNRSHETVYEFTREAVDYLFKEEDCALVIIACNTASARALRRIQQEYLPTLNKGNKKTPSASGHSPLAGGDKYRRVLGVLIPSAEEAANFKRVGILATRGTVSSDTFVDEIYKLNKDIKVFQNPAPMLVPLVEEGEGELATVFIKKYLKPLVGKKIEALVLGCTHYPIFKKEIRKILPKNIEIISQDEIIPKKLKDYLSRNSEITKKLSKNKTAKILVTDMTDTLQKLSSKWFGNDTKPEVAVVEI